MKPVIALVGRPNVGKSTLFNRITGSRDAIVIDVPGVTRDRQYGHGQLGDLDYIVVDTGGVTETYSDTKNPLQKSLDDFLQDQTRAAMLEADAIVFVVDARDGILPADRDLASDLRKLEKPVYVAINKAEGIGSETARSDFYSLGFENEHVISAKRGDGVQELIQSILESFPTADERSEIEDKGICVSIVGRPNAGKSTLVNAIFGQERVVVSDQPGTTRDSILVPFVFKEKHYSFIDTAGVRRRAKVKETIEKFSVVKTLQAIEESNVVVLVIDGVEGLSEQDASLAGIILQEGKALVIAVNKADKIDKSRLEWLKQEIDRRFPFLVFAQVHFISAMKSTGVTGLFKSIDRAYASAYKTLPTSRLNRELEKAVQKTAPPMVHGRRIKLKFAHQGGQNPPRIIIHGNQVDSVPDSYRRYLSNTFRKAFKLEGTPVVIEFRSGENPYAGKKKSKKKSKYATRR